MSNFWPLDIAIDPNLFILIILGYGLVIGDNYLLFLLLLFLLKDGLLDCSLNPRPGERVFFSLLFILDNLFWFLKESDKVFTVSLLIK